MHWQEGISVNGFSQFKDRLLLKFCYFALSGSSPGELVFSIRLLPESGMGSSIYIGFGHSAQEVESGIPVHYAGGSREPVGNGPVAGNNWVSTKCVALPQVTC